MMKTTLLYKFFRNPKTIGSVLPSSSFLANKMTDNINWGKANLIVELGAGTGVITDIIYRNRLDTCSVVVAEVDADMHKALKNKYPKIHHLKEADAVKSFLKNNHKQKADYVISSLPFAIWPKDVTENIIQDIAHSIDVHGELVLFQYSPYIYPILKKHFAKVSFSLVLLNIPPAIVYKCKN